MNVYMLVYMYYMYLSTYSLNTGVVGWCYTNMTAYVHKALQNLSTIYPSYDVTEGYDLIGWFWHQGWNDGYIHTLTHTYTHTYIYTYTHVHIHIFTYIHIYTHIYIHTYMHIHIFIYTYKHINAYRCSVNMSAEYQYNMANLITVSIYST